MSSMRVFRFSSADCLGPPNTPAASCRFRSCSSCIRSSTEFSTTNWHKNHKQLSQVCIHISYCHKVSITIMTSENLYFTMYYISQRSVAIQLRCRGIFNSQFIANFPQTTSEWFIKIGQNLAKIRTEVWWHVFWLSV